MPLRALFRRSNNDSLTFDPSSHARQHHRPLFFFVFPVSSFFPPTDKGRHPDRKHKGDIETRSDRSGGGGEAGEGFQRTDEEEVLKGEGDGEDGDKRKLKVKIWCWWVGGGVGWGGRTWRRRGGDKLPLRQRRR